MYNIWMEQLVHTRCYFYQATEEAIPLIIRSCIRAINLYGMHHEGVFRVSGLQAEINEIKASFEKG